MMIHFTKYFRILSVLSFYCLGIIYVNGQDLEAISADTLQVEANKYVSMLNDTVSFGFYLENNKHMVGAVSSVKPADVMDYDNAQYVRDLIDGKILGLNGSQNIRNFGSALIVVDGIPGRSIDILNSEEIEEITILKDAVAAAMYGSMAQNGVIVITTKRGGEKTEFNVSASTGIKTPLQMPSFLNSAEYMTLYNEARDNDGLLPIYSQDEIDNTLSGINPYRYPDVDFYSSDYQKPFASYSNVVADFSGSQNSTRYYINVGFKSDGSLQDVSDVNDRPDYRFNVRGNIDFKINDWIKSSLDVMSVVEAKRSSLVNLYSKGFSFRPNLYSPLLPSSMVDTSLISRPIVAGQQTPEEVAGILNAANIHDGYLMGGAQAYTDNVPIADIYAGGYTKNMKRMSQVNSAIDFDLSTITEGLSAKTYVSFDFYNAYNLTVNNKYAVYEPTWDSTNVAIVGLNNVKDADRKDATEHVETNMFIIRYGFYGLLNYEKQITEKHGIDATLMGFSNNTYSLDVVQPAKNNHAALSLKYNYNDRFLLDFTSAYVNSVKLPEGNRAKLAPSLGLAYIIRNNTNSKDFSWLDYLKVRASGGIIYSDMSISDYFLYDAVYEQDGGGYSWGDASGNASSNSSTTILRGQNNHLTFPKRTDYNLGFEALLWHKLWLEGNVFQSTFSDQIIQASTLYPQYYSSFRQYQNFNESRKYGLELGLDYSEQFGPLNIDLGLRAMYTGSEKTIVDEIHAHDYQYRKGTATDAIWGLEADGLFQMSDFNTDGTLKDGIPTQYGTVHPGDIKYLDKSNDHKIDDNDMDVIGHWNSPWNFSSDLKFELGNFTLYTLLTASVGGDGLKSGSYYRPQANDKYSEVVNGRWTEATATTATYPRLTSTGSTNNFDKTSTYWMYNNNNFQIRRIQLTYNFPSTLLDNIKLNSLGVYATVNNVLEISEAKEIRELSMGGSPYYRYYSIGLRVNF